MADQPVGWLATTVTLYDELEKDIRRAFPSIHQAVSKVLIRFPDTQLHQDIAKSVAVLQILGNLPISLHERNQLDAPVDHGRLADRQVCARPSTRCWLIVLVRSGKRTVAWFS